MFTSWHSIRWLPGVLLALSFTPHPVWADTREDIQAQYDRSSEATRLKFLDGIFCIRAKNFRLVNQEGQQLDLNVERTRMEQFLAPALKVQEKVTINDLDAPSDHEAVCTVTYVTKLRMHNRLTDKESDQVLTTRCTDRWTRVNGKWKMLESKVEEQDFQR